VLGKRSCLLGVGAGRVDQFPRMHKMGLSQVGFAWFASPEKKICVRAGIRICSLRAAVLEQRCRLCHQES